MWLNGAVLHERIVKADKGTKDQDKQQGRYCLLAKSTTAKSGAESLLCQITGWKLELVPRARMFNSGIYSVMDLDDATFFLKRH